MEELVTTDAIQKEILDDARRKAERLLKEADDEAARALSSCEDTAQAVVAEIHSSGEARLARYRHECLARVPLEKTRMKTEFVDRKMREGLADWLSRLPDGTRDRLMAALLARGAPSLAGKDATLAWRGISEARAAALAARALPGTRVRHRAEDETLPAQGLVASAADGTVVVHATLDLVEERLLGNRRGELAAALCGEALEP